MTRKGFTCLTPLAWQSDESIKATVERFQGYSLIVTTFGGGGPPRSFVERLKRETGAIVAAYTDLFYLSRYVFAEDRFVRRARDGTLIDRWGDGRGLFLHTPSTIEALCRSETDEAASHDLFDFFLDNMEPTMPPWLVTYFGDQARPSRVLQVNGVKMPPANVAALFAESSAIVTVAMRQAAGPDAVIVANTGMPRRDPAIDGVCLEDDYNPGSWMSSLPPAVPNPKQRYDCAIIRNDEEKAAREAMKLPPGTLRLYQGDA